VPSRKYGRTGQCSSTVVSRAWQKTGASINDKGDRHYYMASSECMTMPGKVLSLSLSSAPSLFPGRAPGYSRGRRSSTAAGPSFHNATLTRSAINESLAMRRQKNTRIQWDRCIIKKVVRRSIPFHGSPLRMFRH